MGGVDGCDKGDDGGGVSGGSVGRYEPGSSCIVCDQSCGEGDLLSSVCGWTSVVVLSVGVLSWGKSSPSVS